MTIQGIKCFFGKHKWKYHQEECRGMLFGGMATKGYNRCLHCGVIKELGITESIKFN